MRRLWRWIINGLTILSLLLLAGLWVRSCWRNDSAYELATPSCWFFQSNGGDFTVTRRVYKGVTWDHGEWHFESGPAVRLQYEPQQPEPWDFVGLHHWSNQYTQAA